MARLVKDKALFARVDEPTYAVVYNYLEEAELGMGELVRQAVKEYIKNHPAEEEEA